MAVSVARAPVFKGDATDLLDRLVEACNSKPQLTKPLAERDLEAFDWASWALPESNAAKPQVQPRKKAQQPRPAAAVSPVSSGSKRAVSPTNSGAKSPPRKHPQQLQPSEGVTPIRASAASAAPAPPSVGCPGFFNSPKPEALPMPTFSLLSRAACAQA